MKHFPASALVILAAFLAFATRAQEAPSWEVQALNQIIPGTVEGKLDYDMANGTAKGTNGVFVKYGTTTLTADSGTLDTKSGEMVADGHVRIESADQLWVGDHIRYNFKTHQMQSESFRTGRWPVFAGGTDLTGNSSNRVFIANHAYVTTDDAAEPAFQVRASRIKIISGKVVQMWNAFLYVDGVPVFYRRAAGDHRLVCPQPRVVGAAPRQVEDASRDRHRRQRWTAGSGPAARMAE